MLIVLTAVFIHKVQVTGLGKLRPNILIVGFKANWYAQGVDGLSEINGYFGVIQ